MSELFPTIARAEADYRRERITADFRSARRAPRRDHRDPRSRAYRWHPRWHDAA